MIPATEETTATPEQLFEGKGLTKEFDGIGVQALRGLDFRIGEGEFVAILGACGPGHGETVLRCATVNKTVERRS